jgi:large subunit ribosomal protein L17
MRKQVFGRQLGRTKNQRQALFRGLIASLIKEGEIETTLPKAKSIKSQAEKMITKARAGTVADRRVIFKLLNKRTLVNRLVEEIAPLFKSRPGGYLRIVRVGRRKGDNAEIARVMFTENVGKMLPRVKVSEEKKTETTKEEKKVVRKSTKKTEEKND